MNSIVPQPSIGVAFSIKNDYSELTQPSAIAFLGSHNGLAAALEMAIQEDSFSVIDPQIPEAALRKILAAARTSSALSVAKKRLLPSI